MRFAWIFIFAFFFISCEKRQIEPQSRNVLGTLCTINLYEDGSKNLYDRIFHRLEEIDDIFNPYKDDSEIVRVNKNAQNCEIEVNAEFAHVLQAALLVCEASEGAFNPALGKTIDLWGINNKENLVPENGVPPKKNKIDEAIKTADWKKITVWTNENKAFVSIPSGLKIDLCGIVKGYAADSVASIVKKANVKAALINLGGNVYVFGEKSDKSPWIVGIKDPENPDGEPALSLTGVRNKAIVTSGIYERFYKHDGKIYHHIIDPKTGAPVQNDTISVTVVCASSMYADALATAFLVEGAQNALNSLETLSFLPEFRGENRPLLVAITEDGKAISSEELRGYVGVLLDDFSLEFR